MGAFYITSYGNSTKFKATVHNHIKAIIKGQGQGISPGNYKHDTWLLSQKTKGKENQKNF